MNHTETPSPSPIHNTATQTAGALGHLRVLDLSRVLAGPWCTQNLADMRADVIKIEKPGEGDDRRHWGPPFFPDAQGNPSDNAVYFAACNRNKRSITVDMSTAEGQQLRQVLHLPSHAGQVFEMGDVQRRPIGGSCGQRQQKAPLTGIQPLLKLP